MKRIVFLLFVIVLIGSSCKDRGDHLVGDNPLLTEWQTPFQIPPFDKIKAGHFLPAIQEAMKQHDREIEAIVNSSDEPDVVNTIEALDYSGEMLDRITAVFFNLTSSETDRKLQDAAREISPMLTRHEDDILFNAELFQRIKTVYDKRKGLGLTPEQERLVTETYKKFVRGGANLDSTDQSRLREINRELSLLSLRFEENLLEETNGYQMVITDEADLAGLPQTVISAAAEAALTAGKEGTWVFTLHKPSMIPFLQYAENRALREQIFKAYINRCSQGNMNDNTALVSRIASLRVQRSHLLSATSFADFILGENMAKTSSAVYRFLDRLWVPALDKARQEAAGLQALIDEEKGGFTLQPWDWWYYTEKLRKIKFDVDEEILRPYFKLDQVIKGAFDVAHRLWGIRFNTIDSVPKYHPDVEVWEVIDKDDSHLGVIFMDFYPRETKQSGAWEDEYRKQYRKGEKRIHPVVTVNFNFPEPIGSRPSLLNLEEVATLFHEFGHALHSLLSDCTYPSLSGTDVAIDFVELPSQIMENWAMHPEVMKTYAMHYETGEPIPDTLLEKINAGRYFNQGFITVEYLAACYLDMDWHMLTDTLRQDALAFESSVMERIDMMPGIVVRYRSPYFSHIFSGQYPAGYYSYIWAEVLDKDAFQMFVDKGLFDQATAASFRENILSKGNTADPLKLYVKFRGREPSITPLLKYHGLL